MFELFPELGSDLERYVVTEREPLATTFAGAAVLTTPTPSRGGEIVASQASIASRRDGVLGEPGSVDEALGLVRALAEGYAAAPDGAASGAKPTGTTHVSVVDSDGAVAALSSTLGSGSGVFRHGFQLNNMLGELDVIGEESGSRDPPAEHDDADDRPGRRPPPPRRRERGLGQARGRDHAGDRVGRRARAPGRRGDRTAAAPRRRQVVHVEGGWDDGVASGLAEAGWEVVPWAARNLFFGGTSAVELLPGARRPPPAIRAAGGMAPFCSV